MREAEEVKRLGATLATLLSTFDGETPELDQPRLRVVQFQTELGQTCPEFLQARLRFTPVFKADHEVVRVANDDDVTPAAMLSPPFDPQVKDIV